MNLTRFETLLHEVNKLGATQAIAVLSKNLQTGIADADPNDIVFGEHGLYLIDERGFFTRVILHIVDKSMNHFDYDTRRAIESDNFDNANVVENSHRYHLVNCSTLRRANAQGWRDRYKMNQNLEARFHYRYLSDKQVFPLPQLPLCLSFE